MTHASLFSGEGGFDLAADWMGWDNLFHCEINPFCQNILKHYWPQAELYDDITKTDFRKWYGRIDVLTGGFPCQPFSNAGKRKGTADARHLWPEMLRAIREIRPRWIVGENVRGLVNWDDGLVFDQVQSDLETEDYKVAPFLLPACGVNAPHRRERIFFIAYRENFGRQQSGTSRYGRTGFTDDNSAEQLPGTLETTRGRNEQRILDKSSKDGQRTELHPGYTTSADPDSTSTEHNISAGRNLSTGTLQQDATNTKSNGQQRIHGEYEVNAGEGRQYAQRNTVQMGCDDAATVSGATRSPAASRRTTEDRGKDVPQSQQRGNTTEQHNRRAYVPTTPTDTSNQGLQRGQQFGTLTPNRTECSWKSEGQSYEPTAKLSKIGNWLDFPTVPPLCGGNDGISERLDTYTVRTGFTKPLTFSKWRTESIKAHGNAVVPQVVLQILKAIDTYELLY